MKHGNDTRGPSRPGPSRPPRGKFGGKPGGPPRPDGDKPFRPKRPAGEAPSWRPEGLRSASRPFRDDGAGEKRGFKPGGRPAFGARRDDDRGRPKPGGSRPYPDRSEARPAPPRSEAPPASPEEPAEDRIAKVIARAGIASRRDAEAMIAEGRVTLNGEVLASPAVNVTKADSILVDGEPLPSRERTRLWLFHKPRGLVTTARDPEGRPTVFENLPEDLPRVVAIGRLDMNTEGLLLLTNDGGLAKVIAHPDTGWLRRYKVRAHGEVTQADLDPLLKGVTVDDMEYGPVEARLDRFQGDNVWLTLGLREGKNREVKRILEHLGLSVNRLIRLSFGPFQLGEIEPGLVEEVRTKVLKEQLGAALAAQAEVDFESPVREPIAPFGSPKERDEPSRTERPQRRDERAFENHRERPRERSFEDRDERRPPPRPKRDPLAPKRSVWRAGEDETAPRPPRRGPPRGADARQERAASGERPRERAGSIAAPAGRTVRVERLVSRHAEEPRRAPRADDRLRRPRSGDERAESRPAGAKPGGPRPFRERTPERSPSAGKGGFGAGPREAASSKGAGPREGFKGGFKDGPRTGPRNGFKGGPKGGSNGGFKGGPRGGR